MDRAVETSPLTLRADIGAVDTDARTIDLVFSTGAAVDRYDYRLGEYFVETLSLDPAHVRLARVNAGASVLDAHHGWSIRSVIGGVVPDSVKLAAKRMTGRVLMSANDDVAPILRNIKDKIVRFASVGYQVYQYRDTGKTDKRGWRILEAIDWEPFEVSFVPVPADFMAQTRAVEPKAQTYRSLVISAVTDADRMRALALARYSS